MKKAPGVTRGLNSRGSEDSRRAVGFYTTTHCFFEALSNRQSRLDHVAGWQPCWEILLQDVSHFVLDVIHFTALICTTFSTVEPISPPASARLMVKHLDGAVA